MVKERSTASFNCLLQLLLFTSVLRLLRLALRLLRLALRLLRLALLAHAAAGVEKTHGGASRYADASAGTPPRR